MSAHHVFFSFGGHDRVAVRRIAAALRDSGLDVFMDEDITPGHGVTATIEQALASSRVVLMYYSAGYPRRYACQFELTVAFLAGQREGNATRRIVVINPHPGTDQLSPVELSDATFVRAPVYGDKTALAVLVKAVKKQVLACPTPIGEVSFTDRPRWVTDRLAGAHSFTGRYREQWALHSHLHEGTASMVREVKSGSAVALVGIAGCGKTALAAAYA